MGALSPHEGDRPPRIAFVNQPFSGLTLPLKTDSLGIWAYHVAVRCAAAGWNVVFYTPEVAGAPPRERHRGVEIVRIPSRRDQRVLAFLERIQRALARRGMRFDPHKPLFARRIAYLEYAVRIGLDLRRRDVDAVHLHNFSQFIPIWRALHRRVRIVINMQCEWLKTLHRGWIEPRIRAVDRVVGCTGFIANGVRGRFPEHAEKCSVLDNGFDQEMFPARAAPAARREGGPRLLYVGRISPEKGVHVLLAALPTIAERHPDVRLSLIGGQGSAPPEYLIDLSDDPDVLALRRFYPGSYLEAVAAMVPPALRDRVEFVPNLPQQELLARYRDADLFVFPSACNEAFGMPTVEAMALGLPIVASRIGGIPEVVPDGETGVLVPAHDPEALGRAIADLWDDPERLRRMGEAGPRRVAQYTWDHVAASLRADLAQLDPRFAAG